MNSAGEIMTKSAQGLKMKLSGRAHARSWTEIVGQRARDTLNERNT